MRNLAILVCLSVSSAAALSADLTRDQLRQYYDAYGAVQGMIASLDYMRDSCGDAAKDVRKTWDARNALQRAQAEDVLQKALREVTKQFGEKAGKDVELRIRQRLTQLQGTAVEHSFAKFAALPADQKTVACSTFAAEVSAGAWDVQKKDPVLFKFLETESQK